MSLKVVLPHFLCSNANENELMVECSNISELYDAFYKRDTEIVNKIFSENKSFRRNVILVLDGKMVKKSEFDNIKFGEKGVLEILLQLAGG